MTFEKKIPTMNIKINNQDKNIKKEEKETNKEIENKEETIKEVNTNVNIEELQQQIEEMKQKNKNLEEKLLYLAAELQNTKKRNEIELENAHKFAINKFAIDAVGIYDVLQTALENANIEQTDKTFYDGVKMTVGEFDKMFDRLQIVKINPEIGSTFDHNKQEAIARVKDDKFEVGKIVKVIRVGYEIYGRILRTAMVIVSGGKN